MNPFPSSSPASKLFTRIRADAGPMGIVAGPPKPSRAADEIGALPDEELLGERPADPLMAAAVRAGLLLLADRMDASHSISKGIETPEGSWWHGILHRREPDYSNARYWFRRVGRHPLMAGLGTEAADAGEALERVAPGGRWDPFALIDLCEEARRGSGALVKSVEALQEHEVLRLLAHCHEAALGGRREPR